MVALNLLTREPRGPATAPLLILCRARGAPASMWDRVASLLVPDFRVQVFEHSGHAGAPAASGPFSTADLADGVAQIIERSGAGRPRTSNRSRLLPRSMTFGTEV